MFFISFIKLYLINQVKLTIKMQSRNLFMQKKEFGIKKNGFHRALHMVDFFCQLRKNQAFLKCVKESKRCQELLCSTQRKISFKDMAVPMPVPNCNGFCLV